MSINIETVLGRCREENVHFLRLQFTDIDGIIKNVEVPESQFEKALLVGLGAVAVGLVGRAMTEGFPFREAVNRGDELLSVEGLTYRGNVEPVSLNVREGEIVGVAGLVGSGRTEAMRAIFGADKASIVNEAIGALRVKLGHDLGLIAATRTDNGTTERGFRVFVGGGLGAVPYQSQLFAEFLPEYELLPLAQAIARVFGRFREN